MKRGLMFIGLVFVFAFSLSAVAAHGSAGEENGDYHLKDLLENVTDLNEELQENEVLIPDSLGYIVKEGNIGVNISMNSEDVEGFYIVIEGNRVSEVAKGFPEESNYDILTEESIVDGILASEDVAAGILEAYDNGDIKIKANGFGNKVKLFFGKIFLKMFT